MSEFEKLADQCVARGYYPWMRRDAKNWTCELRCGVDVMPTNISRPRAVAATAVEALVAAMEKIA